MNNNTILQIQIQIIWFPIISVTTQFIEYETKSKPNIIALGANSLSKEIIYI